MRTYARALIAAAIFSAACLPMQAGADDFPSHSIRIIVPYAPGGPSDLGARLMAKTLTKHIGQSVYIENKPAAAGLVETEAYVKADADGYTLLVGAIGPFAIIPNFRTVHYDVAKDFVPLALVWKSSQVLLVNPKLGVKTLAEFMAYAKAHPGKITVGSAGVGSVTHMALEQFKHETHLDLVHVPYRGTGAMMPNLLGGQIDAAFAEVTLVSQYVDSGKLAGLAITSPERSAQLPNIPTTAESGLPGVDTQNWFGIVASPKTPPDRLGRLQAAVKATLADPEYQAAVAKQGLTLKNWDADSYRQLIQSQIVKWKPIVKAANLK